MRETMQERKRRNKKKKIIEDKKRKENSSFRILKFKRRFWIRIYFAPSFCSVVSLSCFCAVISDCSYTCGSTSY